MFNRVAVLGAGALGLYYGARLARAGVEVGFVARSEAEYICEHGVRVKAPDGAFEVRGVRASADPAEIGPADLVLVGLKATANGELGRLLPPLMKAGTAVLTLQNGLGVDEPVVAVAGEERTLGGLCFVCVNRVGKGEAACTALGQVVVGEVAGAATERTRALAALFGRAGVRMVVTDRLGEARWRKLMWNVPFNGLAVAMGGVTTEAILATEEGEAKVWALMREVQAVARSQGWEIPDEFLREQVERTRPMGPYKPSTLVDFVAGKPLEVEPIWGEPIRRARAAGVVVPAMEALYEQLRRHVAGRAG